MNERKAKWAEVWAAEAARAAERAKERVPALTRLRGKLESLQQEYADLGFEANLRLSRDSCFVYMSVVMRGVLHANLKVMPRHAISYSGEHLWVEMRLCRGLYSNHGVKDGEEDLVVGFEYDPTTDVDIVVRAFEAWLLNQHPGINYKEQS